MKYQDFWHEETGTATCRVYYTGANGVNIVGLGYAFTDPRDEPFKSKLTGGTIAEYRADLDMYRQIRDYELKPSIITLKHLQTTMAQSPQYNPDSFEAKRLQRQINSFKRQLDNTNKIIANIQETIRNYIKNKDEMHQRITHKDETK